MASNDPNRSAVQPNSQAPAKRGKGWIFALVGVLVVALVAGGAYWYLNRPDDTGGEIFLEAAAEQSRDPFLTEPIAARPDPAIAQPATGAPPTISSAPATTSAAGNQPGLYGGSQSDVICDTAKLISFLTSNPSKAKAWVDALNADPNLRWSRGTLTTADIPAYITSLTPIILVSDTRVTNHGFLNGKANQLQSVLQKGTGVYVDAYGVPRVRCLCGNPLLPPKPAKTTPSYQGKSWPDFDPGKVGVVAPSAQPITAFQLRVPATPSGQLVTVPAGTTPPPGVQLPPATTPTSGSQAPVTTAPGSQSPVTSAPGAPPAATTPAAPTAPAQPSTGSPTISVGIAQRYPNGDVDYSVDLSGYPPNSQVTLSCVGGTSGSFYTSTVTVDASGGYSSSPFCHSDDPSVSIVDSNGNSG